MLVALQTFCKKGVVSFLCKKAFLLLSLFFCLSLNAQITSFTMTVTPTPRNMRGQWGINFRN